MERLSGMKPHIRTAHFYRFPPERNAHERTRLGYCYAFHLCVQGKGHMQTGERIFPLRKGDLIYLPPLVQHSFYTDSADLLQSYNIYCELWDDAPRETAQHQHLTWNPEQIDNEFVTRTAHCPELDRLPPLVRLQHSPLLQSLFAHIVELHQQRSLASDQTAHRYLHGWITEIAHLKTGEVYDYRIRQLIEKMDNGSLAVIGDTAWAKECQLKKTQFHERFKKMTGMPPYAYWTKRKMEQASAALLESDKSVTEIAEWLGYPSIHHFSKQFTSYYGVAPSMYRGRR